MPPAIIDVEAQTSLIVDEGHRVRLECSATGQPEPKYTWRSDEDKPIRLRSWQREYRKYNLIFFTAQNFISVTFYYLLHKL